MCVCGRGLVFFSLIKVFIFSSSACNLTESFQFNLLPLFSSFSSSALLALSLFTTPLRFAHITLYSLRYYFCLLLMKFINFCPPVVFF